MTTNIARPERFILLALVLLVAAVSGGDASGKDEAPIAITWRGYNEALSEGRDFDKPVFMHFTAPWCKWCKKMQDETYTDRKVIDYMDENFIAVMVDTEKLPALASKYNVDSIPTLWFLDSEGKALTSIPGFVGPEKFLLVLEYISTKAYETTDYKTWAREAGAR